MSSFVVYNTTRKNSAFLVTRGQANTDTKVQFTCEANNVANLNNRKYSGSNNKSVGIEFAAPSATAKAGTRPKAVFTVKAFNKQNKPASATARYTLARGFKKNARAIQRHTRTNRSDLTAMSLARWTKMNASFRGRVANKRTRTGRRASRNQ